MHQTKIIMLCDYMAISSEPGSPEVFSEVATPDERLARSGWLEKYPEAGNIGFFVQSDGSLICADKRTSQPGEWIGSHFQVQRLVGNLCMMEVMQLGNLPINSENLIEFIRSEFNR